MDSDFDRKPSIFACSSIQTPFFEKRFLRNSRFFHGNPFFRQTLVKFLALFAGCFRSRPGFALCKIYVQGLLSSLQRKNVEAMALEFGKAPRTLQRFVESIKWEEARLRDECQRVVARDHAHAE